MEFQTFKKLAAHVGMALQPSTQSVAQGEPIVFYGTDGPADGNTVVISKHGGPLSFWTTLYGRGG